MAAAAINFNEFLTCRYAIGMGRGIGNEKDKKTCDYAHGTFLTWIKGIALTHVNEW
jgi:hypothetical protein